jgi:hypothetical protein
VQFLIRQTPERAQQRAQHQGLVALDAWCPTRTRWQRRRAALLGEGHGHAAQRQQVQAPHPRERVQMQRPGRAGVIGWWRNRRPISGDGQCHRAPPGCGDQPRSRYILPHFPGCETPSIAIVDPRRIRIAARAEIRLTREWHILRR